MRTYTAEQIKDKLWADGIQIMYADLRVLLKYIVKNKTKSQFVVTYADYLRLREFIG